MGSSGGPSTTNDIIGGNPGPTVIGGPGGIHHSFKKGHRIMIQIQSSCFPLFDRNPQTFVPNIYKADDKDFKKAKITIFGDSEIIIGNLK